MSMLLTIAQPPRTELGGRYPHDFSPRIPLAKSRLSPRSRVDPPAETLPASAATYNSGMANSHRGLPPPSAMGLPDPNRPSPLSQALGSLPAPPNQWHGHDELNREWFTAKAEEQKRLQEEEKTRQEDLRLRQRQIEQAMLRDALQAGVPPALVPMIYAGMGGANLASVSNEHLHQYVGQLQASLQQIQQHQGSPELLRETRLLGKVPAAYPAAQPPQQQPVVPSQHVEPPQQGAPLQTTFSAYQPAAAARPGPTSAPRSATHTQLPRLTTNEMYVHPPSQPGPGSAHPLQQSQTVQQEPPASSPSIYFHHWVPPTESKATQPQTPASRGEPSSAHPGSHLSESDYKESPRKRKAQGGHQPNPPPSAGPQHASPSFSTISSASRRGRHARSHSNTSAVNSDSRPSSRRDPDPPRSSFPEASLVVSEERTSLPREEQQTRGSSAEVVREKDSQPENVASRKEGS